MKQKSTSMYRPVIRLLFPLLFFFVALLPASAQQASISGEVTDPHNAVIVNAEVQVINQDTGNKIITKTGKTGAYQVRFLAPGRYQVIVQASGFRPAGSADITLSEGQAVVHNVQLTVGSATASIIVRDRNDSIPNANPEVRMGLWTDTKIQDLPYSISVIPHELIENVQAGSPDQIFRMSPVATLDMPTTLNLRPEFYLRGFLITAVEEDGMRNYNGWVNSVEDVERLEIITGLSGFLYGPGDVGGVVNYVSKRPTASRQADITMGDYGGKSTYIHGDLGGPIDARGKVGYRLNIVAQGGDTAINNQNLNRFLSTGAIDWHATSKLLLQLNASYQNYNLSGTPASWSAAAHVQYPIAPDAAKLWSQPWTYNDLETLKIGTRGLYEINKAFTLRGGYDFAEYQQKSNTLGTTITSNNTYTESFQVRAPRILSDPKGYVYLDSKFKTGFLKHTLTVGYSGDAYKWRQHQDASASASVAGTFTFANPLYVTEPAYTAVGTKPVYTSSTGNYKNALVGDIIEIGRQWRVLAGFDYINIVGKSYSTTGAVSGHPVSQSQPTPSASVVYKPIPQVSTYFTYMQSLEQGVTVGSAYNNAGTIMPPMTSDQYEAGAKATIHGALVTAALFKINRANYYSILEAGNTLPTYTQDGREIHKGIEFTVTGKPFLAVTLSGGLTLMDAEVEKSNTAGVDGKRPTDVSDQLAKVYAERSIPGLAHLMVTGGIYYTGHFWANALNTVELPAVTIGDMGLRYNTRFSQRPLILRANVTNLTNKSYWTSSSFEGDPRTIAVSAQMKF
jgi:iron complex outermembrane recepter protein